MIASSMAHSAVSSMIAHSAEAPKVTPKPAPSPSSVWIDDWRTRATWPVGCEEWANPCPQGVPLEDGGTARTLPHNYVPVGSQSGYTNGFTSFLTMTDANGVVTGMPPVATLPAGVTKLPDWVTMTSAAPKPGMSTMSVNALPPPPHQSTAVKGSAPAASAVKSASASASTSGSGGIISSSSASSISQTVGISFVLGLVGLVAIIL